MPVLHKGLCLLLCAALLPAGCAPRHVAAASSQAEHPPVSAERPPEQKPALPVRGEVEDEYAYVTGGIDFGLPPGPAFLHPSGDTQTAGTRYYLTGTSDPARELLLNGEPVEDRGQNGSFAVFVSLSAGDNVFTLRQGEDSVSVTIGHGTAESSAVTTSEITLMEPTGDIAVPGGTFTLQCVAPAGKEVSARIQGHTIPLRQNTPAQAGVPATFSAEYELPEPAGTTEIGTVAYIMDGREVSSEGRIFVIPDGARTKVEIRNVSSSVFTEASVNSPVLTTGKRGAVDEVVDFGGDAASGEMYQLRMGGWIQAAAAVPLADDIPTDNVVSGVSFSAEDGRETVTLSGTARPFYLAERGEDAIVFRFYHTSGIENIDVGKSGLFSGAEAAADGADSLVTFRLRDPDMLWGYLVEYDGGSTAVSFLRRPAYGGEQLPLKGVTVAVDAGHGGTDTGTLGLPYSAAPMEKDVTIATAEALEKALGLLGAEVVMVRHGDENPTMNARMERARAAWADFYISLHANSAGYSPELISAAGLEVYYFEPEHGDLAALAAERVSEATGRKNRGARCDNYRVTMQSFAPSILIELGFMPNPGDFDSMCDPEGIYQTVTAIAGCLADYLAPAAET